MPTALVLLAFPYLSRWIKRSPWTALAALLAARLWADYLVRAAGAAPADAVWLSRFLLTEGFGGFPVLPFFLNGCVGIWLGMLRYRKERQWHGAMALLLLLQLVLYFGNTYFSDILRPLGMAFLMPFGALGKFAWVFLMAYAVTLVGGRFLTSMLSLIGQHALGSFVMHRVFLQGLSIVLASTALGAAPLEVRYTTLWIGTLFLTWALCVGRRQVGWIDTSLRRVAL